MAIGLSYAKALTLHITKEKQAAKEYKNLSKDLMARGIEDDSITIREFAKESSKRRDKLLEMKIKLKYDK